MESLRFLKLAFTQKGSIDELYRFLGPDNLLTREKRYVNLGFWSVETRDLDEAGEAMADLLARKAGLGGDDSVLDAGFGYGEQDFFWIRKYGPKKIDGVNLCGPQIDAARERALKLGLQDRCVFHRADATDLPFADATYDVVTALESAFHFKTREAFLKEAFRVLKPGGRLVMADLLGDLSKLSFLDRAVSRIGLNFWQMPKENLYSSTELARRLETIGFESIEVESIWERVHPPYIRFARQRLESDDVKTRMNPWLRRMLLASAKGRRRLNERPLDYVLASARKPLQKVLA